MREILFRGKRSDNGEWVVGYFCEFANNRTGEQESYIQTVKQDGRIDLIHKVDPATIGQYTGLNDKNGKRIFEGDIVKATITRDMGGGADERSEQGIIGYDAIGMLGLINHFYNGVPVWTDFFHELSLSGLIVDYSFEVVGTIHDNPELIGGEG